MAVSVPQTLPLDIALQNAVAHHQEGRLQEAEQLYRAILQAQSDQPDANHNLGVLEMQVGRHAIGLPYLKSALAANPTRGQYVVSYAEALLATDQAKEALDILQTAMQRGHDTPAIQALRQKAEAAVLESNATNEAPALTEINQLFELFSDRRYAELESRARVLVNQYPRSGIAWKALGISLHAQGKDALPALQNATEFLPDDDEAYNVLGLALEALGQLDGAVANFGRALEINPVFAEAHNNMGIALQGLGQLNGAVASYRLALDIKPDYAEAHSNLGRAVEALGRLDDAVTSFSRALEIKPDSTEVNSNLLFLYGYHALIHPHEYLAKARNWEQACLPAQDRQAACNRKFQRAPLVGRRLKVGYVSGDYHEHPVSYNMEQVFAHHDRARIELFAYSAFGRSDAVTERLQALAEHWIPIMGIPDAAARDRVDADGIDVLIDLSGHSAYNRMGVFARRAAPVQVYYLGYFASTGLTEMDYLIGDDILTPPETDSHFSERVWRLPRIWLSYSNKIDAPLSDWRPAQDGSIWLGSFNNLGKLTPATLAIWAKVLHALPEAKLLLKTKELADVGNRRRILDAMLDHAILPDRIELQDWSATPDRRSHMVYYDRLDIALDPVGGMGGGTTTCEALWMGAPIITLAGDRMSSRITATMLNAVGHPEWIARSDAEYIAKVVALARDVEQRKALRSSQRSRMEASPLCDAHGLAASLETTYFEMFERWFDGRNLQDLHTHAQKAPI
jgi:predicted O-linked N-acetylglucosamine transferase (SPINDLY family)